MIDSGLRRLAALIHWGLQGYLALVLALFYFGPWPWHNPHPVLMAAYLICAQGAIYVAYRFVVRGRAFHMPPNLDEIRLANTQLGLRVFYASFAVSLAFVVPTSLSRTGTTVPDVLAGIANTGWVYNDNFERLTRGNPFVVVEYARLLFSPLLLAFMPLLLVFWSRIDPIVRILSVMTLLAYVAISVAIGVNKGLIDPILLTPVLVLAAAAAQSGGLRIPRSWLFAGIGGLFVVFLIFFGQGQEERAGMVGVSGIFYDGLHLTLADSSALSGILTDQQRIIYESLTRYLTCGYYGLALSFDVQHAWTYGIGNSMFLARNAETLFGTDYFVMESIPGQMEITRNYSQFGLWHSFFTWWASDLGYLGALVLAGLFFALLLNATRKFVYELDWVSITLFTLLIQLFLYLPANNQIFQTGETCVGFLALLVYSRLRRPVAPTVAGG